MLASVDGVRATRINSNAQCAVRCSITNCSVDKQEVNKFNWKNFTGGLATVVNTDVPPNIAFEYCNYDCRLPPSQNDSTRINKTAFFPALGRRSLHEYDVYD